MKCIWSFSFAICFKNKLIEMYLVILFSFAVTLVALWIKDKLIEIHLVVKVVAICLMNKLIEMHLIILFCCYTRGNKCKRIYLLKCICSFYFAVTLAGKVPKYETCAKLYMFHILYISLGFTHSNSNLEQFKP